MGIAGLSRSPVLSMLLGPVCALVGWFMPKPKFTSQLAVSVGNTGGRISATSRLKIVREFDLTVSPACTGRMVISGRMADVCAELDRMARRENPMR